MLRNGLSAMLFRRHPLMSASIKSAIGVGQRLLGGIEVEDRLPIAVAGQL